MLIGPFIVQPRSQSRPYCLIDLLEFDLMSFSGRRLLVYLYDFAFIQLTKGTIHTPKGCADKRGFMLMHMFCYGTVLRGVLERRYLKFGKLLSEIFNTT
jgi:hypothetical protein